MAYSGHSERLSQSPSICLEKNRVDMPENLATDFDDPTDTALYQAVLSLPEKYRIVILLYYYEEYSIQEISKILSRNPSTIQTQLARAREKLHIRLEHEKKGGFYYGETEIATYHESNSNV
ncbi:MAG: sigma-70 family RNA polymerase sigma factor [Ruminococcus sp.]|nr:sigma-70 family RNA polymerase sigma factor [Ruminococcus sp.]